MRKLQRGGRVQVGGEDLRVPGLSSALAFVQASPVVWALSTAWGRLAGGCESRSPALLPGQAGLNGTGFPCERQAKKMRNQDALET